MQTKDFYYDLPPELIATDAAKRGESKMMVLNRKTREITDSYFKNILDYIDESTTVVFNASKVIPARFYGKKESGGKVEFLLIREISQGVWESMTKTSKRLHPGDIIQLEENRKVKIIASENGLYIIQFDFYGAEFFSWLDKVGDVPLPPYILKQRGENKSRPEDKNRYQTVYADIEGSVAAPTAGLHFSDELIEKIREKTGRVEKIYLHVGLGTFLPVKEESVENHKMHREDYYIPEEVAKRLNNDKQNGRKILAIGTTTVRALETASDSDGKLKSGHSYSEIFIYPGYTFKFVDKIVTNFHLPESTLIMMISAFAGKDFIMEAYEKAVERRYRFYSYGDGMIIL